MHSNSPLLFSSLPETTQFLIQFYVAILFLNTVIAASLWVAEKISIFKWLFIFWLTCLLATIAEAILQQNQVAIMIGYTTCYAMTFALARILADIMGFQLPFKKLISILAFGFILTLLAIQLQLSFFWMAIPTCIAVMAPMAYSGLKTLFSAKSNLSLSKRALAVTELVFSVHMLDFSIIRTRPEALSFGLSIGIVLAFLVSVFAPLTIIEKISNDLRKALGVRGAILSMVSHELRTPLTALKLQMALLRRFVADENVPGSISRVIEASEQQMEDFNDVVENLLEVTEINTGSLTVSMTKFNLSELLEASLERFQPRLHAARCKIQSDITPKVLVSGDPGRLEKVFTHLMINAIKYAPGSPLEFRLEKAQGLVRFSLKDLGPGILEEDRERIFSPFEKAGFSQLAYSRSGLGLGLYISKYIVEHHQGTLSVESTQGKGARFIVELPCLDG